MICYAIRPVVALSIVIAFVIASSSQAGTVVLPTSTSSACALLTPADIAKATGLTVGNGTAGMPIPGVLGKCMWTGTGSTKVIITLGDAQHMQMTLAAQQQSGGTAVPGIGSKAVGVRGPAFTGGGYIVNVLDTKGGFGVSILGEAGTRNRAVALAKLIESRR